MRRLLMVVALAFAAVAPAAAADLPQPAPPPPRAPVAYIPATVAVYNWGGVYFGINGGYGFGSSDWTPSAGCGTNCSGSFSTNGGLVGTTLGANFQTDAFVFGVEGDIDWTDIKGTSASASCTGATQTGCETLNTWLGTVRARAGYAVDRVLFYGTAGGAFGNVEATAVGTSFGTNSSTKFGWTAGAGVEAAFAYNWTARIEYLFVDLANGSCTTACPGSATPIAVKFDASLIRLGLDYKFR
jgi:outer membrane immunogenic protein